MQSKFLQLILLLCLATCLRLFLINMYIQDPSFRIQQDAYADYAQAIYTNELETFPAVDKRLFPGYPLLIAFFHPLFLSDITAGLFISLVAVVLAIYIFWLLTENILLTTIFAFFPPVWVMQSIKVATEPITVLLLLLACFFYLKKHFFLVGLIVGAAFTIRIIALCLILSFLFDQFTKKNYWKTFSLLLGFISIASWLFVYNFFIFDGALFYQFTLYQSSAKATIGIVQITQDIFRAYDWKQYRILASGVLYLLINCIGILGLYKRRNISSVYHIACYWTIFSLGFIFIAGPTPLLEEFARYSVPFTPAVILGILSYGNPHLRQWPRG